MAGVNGGTHVCTSTLVRAGSTELSPPTFPETSTQGLTPGFGVLQLLVQTAGWAPGLP